MARTLGAKNKAKSEFDTRFDNACRKRILGVDENGKPIKFNLLELLIDIAAGLDTSEQWNKQDRLKASTALLDKRYANKREHSGQVDGSELPSQIVITYDDSQRGKPVLAPVSTMGTAG